jgi:hypothetical protein
MPITGELGHPRRPVSPPVGAIKLTLDVEEPPAPRDPTQLAFATINELDARSRYQRRHDTRNEDLTGTGQGPPSSEVRVALLDDLRSWVMSARRAGLDDEAIAALVAAIQSEVPADR